MRAKGEAGVEGPWGNIYKTQGINQFKGESSSF